MRSNILIFSDLHICKKDLKECSIILNEIINLCKQYNINKIIDLGDTFDILKPSSEELDLFADFISKLNLPITVLAAKSHESTDSINSILNHYGILNDKIKIVREYQDGLHLYCGHFFLKESIINFGATISKEQLKEYKHVFLGHCHSYQKITESIYHIGSSRFVDYLEVNDKSKKVAIIENYKEPSESLKFVDLKGFYPMIDIFYSKSKKSQKTGYSVSNLREFEDILDSFSPETKIRINFEDFESYYEASNILSKYKEKFVLFKEKKNFIIKYNNLDTTKQKNITLKESLYKYLKKNNINKKIQKILKEEINVSR